MFLYRTFTHPYDIKKINIKWKGNDSCSLLEGAHNRWKIYVGVFYIFCLLQDLCSKHWKESGSIWLKLTLKVALQLCLCLLSSYLCVLSFANMHTTDSCLILSLISPLISHTLHHSAEVMLLCPLCPLVFVSLPQAQFGGCSGCVN